MPSVWMTLTAWAVIVKAFGERTGGASGASGSTTPPKRRN